MPKEQATTPSTELVHLRCQANEREDSDVVGHADDEDDPQAQGEVFHVPDADLLSSAGLLARVIFSALLSKAPRTIAQSRDRTQKPKPVSEHAPRQLVGKWRQY